MERLATVPPRARSASVSLSQPIDHAERPGARHFRRLAPGVDLIEKDFAIGRTLQRQPPIEDVRRSRVPPYQDDAGLRSTSTIRCSMASAEPGSSASVASPKTIQCGRSRVIRAKDNRGAPTRRRGQIVDRQDRAAVTCWNACPDCIRRPSEQAA